VRLWAVDPTEGHLQAFSFQGGAMGVRIREKKPGEWWVFISHNGKRWSKKVGADLSLAQEIAKKTDARLILGEFELDKTLPPPLPSFQECAEVWLALPREDWKESTLDSYCANLSKHVYPVIGAEPIDHIRRKHLKALFDKLAMGGLSRATLSLIKAPVSGVFNYAVDSEIIEANPLKDLSISTRKIHLELEPLTEDEAARLLEQARRFLGGYYYPHLLCMLRTGLRLGELKALQWQGIDFEKRQMEIRRSCRRGRLTDTKNRKQRRVDMTPQLTETLKAWETEQKKQALKLGKPFLNTDFVFANRRGEIMRRIALENALTRCLSAAKLRHIRIHDLRHSYSTIRLLKGHNIGDVSYQLGHSSISMTYDVYGHWIPGHFKSEVDELDLMRPNAPQAHPEKHAV
jgi:integrase